MKKSSEIFSLFLKKIAAVLNHFPALCRRLWSRAPFTEIYFNNKVLSRIRLGAELTAGRGNILSFALSNDGGIIVLVENLLEGENDMFFGTLKVAPFEGIKGNEVDLCPCRLQESGKTFCVFFRIVDSFYNNVFEGDFAAGH